MGDHDTGYRSLFSHSRMMEDLLRGYVARDWIGELDLTSLEPIKESHISDDLRERRNDAIWRLRWHGPDGQREWVYLYVMVEFQSRNDWRMPIRVMQYTALLWLDLLKDATGARSVRLPPILPIVFYNGDAPWRVPVCIEELMSGYPAALRAYIPHVQYLYFDAQRMETSVHLEDRNLVTAVAAYEQCQDRATFAALSTCIRDLLAAPHMEEVCRSFNLWVQGIVAPRLPAGAAGRINEHQAGDPGMLAERAKMWWAEAEAAGEARGKAEGRAEGEARGVAKGIISLIREEVATGERTVDSARARITALRDQGRLPADLADEALGQLG